MRGCEAKHVHVMAFEAASSEFEKDREIPSMYNHQIEYL